jgi:flagellar basal-body rod modification protein FlgD
MRNQDPTSPTDMAQYMSQFAQLSSVEQAIQTNAKLDSLLSSNALDQAEGLIGRTASFTTSDGESTTGKITAVRIIQGGAVATLDNGVDVQLGPGITIS